MKIIICDDNEKILCSLETKLTDIFAFYGMEIDVKTCTEARQVLGCCEKEAYDFALLDIDLPQIDGFQLSRMIKMLPQRRQPLIFFMSAWEYFVYDAFQYQPYDFLRKSHMDEDIENKIGRLIQEYIVNFEDGDRVALVRGEDACVYLREVYYFKSDRNHLEVFTRTNSYRCRERLKYMAEKYPDDLIQTDKQHLVNMQEIEKVRADHILLRDGRRIPLSRRRKKSVEEAFTSYKAKSIF